MKEITTIELKKMMDGKSGFILLDCLAEDYFFWETLPRTINLRWKQVAEKAEVVLPDKDALIITFCAGFTCSASVRCYKNL